MNCDCLAIVAYTSILIDVHFYFWYNHNKILPDLFWENPRKNKHTAPHQIGFWKLLLSFYVGCNSIYYRVSDLNRLFPKDTNCTAKPVKYLGDCILWNAIFSDEFSSCLNHGRTIFITFVVKCLHPVRDLPLKLVGLFFL